MDVRVPKSGACKNVPFASLEVTRCLPGESRSPALDLVSPFLPSRRPPNKSRGRHDIHAGVTCVRRASTRVNLGVPPSRLGVNEA